MNQNLNSKLAGWRLEIVEMVGDEASTHLSPNVAHDIHVLHHWNQRDSHASARRPPASQHAPCDPTVDRAPDSTRNGDRNAKSNGHSRHLAHDLPCIPSRSHLQFQIILRAHKALQPLPQPRLLVEGEASALINLGGHPLRPGVLGALEGAREGGGAEESRGALVAGAVLKTKEPAGTQTPRCSTDDRNRR